MSSLGVCACDCAVSCDQWPIPVYKLTQEIPHAAAFCFCLQHALQHPCSHLPSFGFGLLWGSSSVRAPRPSLGARTPRIAGRRATQRHPARTKPHGITRRKLIDAFEAHCHLHPSWRSKGALRFTHARTPAYCRASAVALGQAARHNLMLGLYDALCASLQGNGEPRARLSWCVLVDRLVW